MDDALLPVAGLLPSALITPSRHRSSDNEKGDTPMGTARDMKASPLSRPHTTMTKYSGPVAGLPNAKAPVRGKKTRTDVAPMSTGAFSKHRNQYEAHVNGKGNRH